MLVLRRAAILGIATLLAAVSNANAIPFTYSYAGAFFGVNDVDFSQVAGNRITGEFTINAVSNIGIAVGNNTALVTSASFFDGLRTLTDVNSTLTFNFGTDALGDIITVGSLNLLLEGPGGPLNDSISVTALVSKTVGPDGETSASTSTPGVFALVSEVPEPGSLALLGVGLIGFAFMRRRLR